MGGIWVVPYADGIVHATWEFSKESTLVSLKQDGVTIDGTESPLTGQKRHLALLRARDIAQGFVDQATAEINAHRT